MVNRKYLVMWEIDIEAGTPREAAEQALAMQRDPESIAAFFTVFTEHGNYFHVDLNTES